MRIDLTSDSLQRIMARVHAEVANANEKWSPYNSAHEALGVIQEEFEEFKDEVKKIRLREVLKK